MDRAKISNNQFENLHNLRKLKFHNCNLNEIDDSLSRLYNLEFLSINKARFRSNPLRYIPRLKWLELESVHLEQNSTLNQNLSVLILKDCSSNLSYFFENYSNLNLKVLKLERISLQYDLVMGDNFNNLEFLTLLNCDLKSLNINKLVNLKSLDLSLNFGGLQIKPFMFETLKNLKKLKLVCHSSIFYILDNTILNGLENSLVNLELVGFKLIDFLYFNFFFSHNQLSRLKFNLNNLKIDLSWFTFLKKLTNIDLSFNQIESLDDVLDLRHDRINQIQFNLIKFNLDYNRIEKLNDRYFSFLYSLEWLSLSGNEINQIDSKAFDGLNNLKYLDLSKNSIKNELDSLSCLSRLETLNLSSNPIENLNVRVFSTLVSLEYLYLGATNLSKIEADLFNGIENLKELYLSENRVEDDLDLSVFKNLKRLEVLQLDEFSSHDKVDEFRKFFGHKLEFIRRKTKFPH